ncbi:MAG: hypothetical protein AABZ33_09105 [Chloroflexota bacterium]
MATGVLYVHGAGNRMADAHRYGALIRAGLKLPEERLSISDWGEKAGARLDRIDLTMPDEPAAADVTNDVLADPYLPIRALPERAPGGGAAGDRDAEILLEYLQFLGPDLTDLGSPSVHLAAAAAEIAASPELAAAGGEPIERIDAAVVAALARSFQRRPKADQAAGAMGVDFDAAKVAIATLLITRGPLSGVSAWLPPEVGRQIALWASRELARRRKQLMREHVVPVADVLYYQRNGKDIRAHVRGEIDRCSKPGIVIGHSLGGIILVETLFGKGGSAENVGLLVTFGSQAPFLSAIGALDMIVPTVPWLNIVTRYDFLSFCASRLWPGKVTDHEIVIERGFPEAHDAYYQTQAFYDAILKHPAARRVLA